MAASLLSTQSAEKPHLQDIALALVECANRCKARSMTTTLSELDTFKKKIDTVVSLATELVKRVVPKDQLMAEIRTDDLGRRRASPGLSWTTFYAKLARAKR